MHDVGTTTTSRKNGPKRGGDAIGNARGSDITRDREYGKNHSEKEIESRIKGQKEYKSNRQARNL